MSEASEKVLSTAAINELVAANPSNTYISIHENIYDVTQFLDEHPGGEEVLKEHLIKENAFKDATEAFEDVGHSLDARDMMQKYLVGTLENKKQRVKPKKNNLEANNKSQGGISGWTWILSLVALTGIAFAYQYYSHRH